MKVSSNMKNFLIGVPSVIFIFVFVGTLIKAFGPGVLFLMFFIVVLGVIGTLVGEAIRDKFKIWR